MKNQPGTIKIKGTDIPARLHKYREKLHLSQSDLADRAGVTYRTVHDLEGGKRDRTLEKTMMLLATALGITLDELVNGDGGSEARANGNNVRRRGVIAGVAILILGVIGVLGWNQVARHAEWEVEGAVIEVRIPYAGWKLWSREYPATIKTIKEAPWDPGQVLIGLGPEDPAGGRLLCLERGTGKLRWEIGADRDGLVQAFGSETVGAGIMWPRQLEPVDLDSDGRMEVVIGFVHFPYYPYSLVHVDQDGHRLGEYLLKGHQYILLQHDLDGDGRPELLVGGTNNSKQYQGAMLTVLDAEHFSGASVDEGCECPGFGEVADGSRLRVIFPAFEAPYMDFFDTPRFTTHDMKITPGRDGRSIISFEIGGYRKLADRLIMQVDHDLRPLDLIPLDSFLIDYSQRPDSLRTGTGPDDPEWRKNWMSRYVRFEEGVPAR